MLLGVDPQGEPPELHPVAGPLGIVGEHPDGETCARRQAFHPEFRDILTVEDISTLGDALNILKSFLWQYRKKIRQIAMPNVVI